jgi:hypothetical protein
LLLKRVTDVDSQLAPRAATIGFGNLLQSEWTTLRTVRSTYWTALVAVIGGVGVAALICARYAQLVNDDQSSPALTRRSSVSAGCTLPRSPSESLAC